ncbi:DUF4129 domain-containing protein [Radiobacillus sp. PE A8.2]|uniref:DUF4129 domain-containing protein n=1 Tax=Radiobacillus sp. PE A8.2 TaxID=3380349 RepID=UPI0038906B88
MANANQTRTELEDILSKNEYTAYYNDSQNWLLNIWDRLWEWFSELLESLFSITPSTSVAGGLLFAILAVVFVIVLLVIALSVQSGRRKRMFRDHPPLQSADEMRWSYQRHVEEANKYEAQADYTLSTRHLFLAVLLYFHEKDWLEARISKTNWEYYEELLRVNQQAAQHFHHLALVFDQVTYGDRVMKEQEYSDIRMEAMDWLESTQLVHEDEKQ